MKVDKPQSLSRIKYKIILGLQTKLAVKYDYSRIFSYTRVHTTSHILMCEIGSVHKPWQETFCKEKLLKHSSLMDVLFWVEPSPDIEQFQKTSVKS